MVHIHFIEGIPGSGKSLLAETTTATSSVNPPIYFLEHHADNPIDVTRKAFLCDEEMAELIRDLEAGIDVNCKYSSEDIERAIHKVTRRINGMNVIAYSNVYFSNKTLTEKVYSLQGKEVCNGLVNKDEYMNLLVTLFRIFAKGTKSDETYIFEGALLQNIFFDLIGFYNVSYAELTEFYNMLISTLMHTDVRVHYLKTNDIYSTLHKAAQRRKDKFWLQHFQDWVKSSPWGYKMNLTKGDYAVCFCEQMQQWSLSLLHDMPYIHYTVYDSAAVILKCLKGEGLCLT